MRGISLSKVNEASFAIFLAALLVSLRWVSLPVSAGLAVGTGLALGSMAMWRAAIRQLLDAPGPQASARSKGLLIIALSMLKLPVVAVLLYAAVTRGWVDPISFVVGVAIPQVAMTLFAVGRKLSAGQENGAAHAAAPRA